MSIPKTQTAAVKQGTGPETTITIQEIPVPTPGPDQILVKISYSGLCASDKSLIHDEWGFAMQPSAQGIAGHEGAGTVVAVGSNAGSLWSVGQRAGIKWIASICGQCEFCRNGTDECHCVKQQNSGFTAPGTFQEYVVTDAKYASRLPEGVKDEEAGPIMCGGVTAYVACKRSAVKPGQWMVVLGAGGGLGHFALQYAKAMGMRVIAIDGGDEKRELCIKLGAEAYVDFTSTPSLSEAVTKLTTYGAHGSIVFAATAPAYAVAPTLLRPGGTMVCVGLPKDTSIVAGAPPVLMCMKRLNVVGSVVGTLKDVEEALDFTARDLVHPILTHGKLEDISRFCKDMDAGKLPGRAVIKIGA